MFSAPTLYMAAFSDGRYESLSCNQSGCAAYNRVRLLLRFELYKTPKSGGAASIWRSACTRQNTVFYYLKNIFISEREEDENIKIKSP